ncbi:MAG: inositol monophosphatase [Nitrospira sp. HN-bin3]|uniref:inositol monophosphatase family protein n=1 Tax=Nitrospira cf. moscoviensis SBR1015 TaxID=96242 RepID=UPI000A0986DB|nr:inositol monophosphatase family protein [Nitrospira cf. moscoviensis SBR1015]OQW43467.1 MAG: inositol monophosphatase [Nitrospira sp. HN-bin3]
MLQSSVPTPRESLSHDVLLQAAVEAGQAAGTLLLRYAETGFQIEYKNPINLVTDADRAAEQCVIDLLKTRFPDHHFLAEERGRDDEGSSPYRWIIDPLDGTTNFAHGYPTYCVSVGLEYEGRCIMGVVFDPSRNELFTAIEHRGAYLNGRPIHVSNTKSLDSSLLVTGFAYDIRETKRNNLDHFAKFALKAQGLRRTGSAALDLCYVAAGRFDGFWEVRLSPWDMAAGSVIAREAGGRLTDFSGNNLSIYGQELVASNGRIHEAMLAVLNQAPHQT